MEPNYPEPVDAVQQEIQTAHAEREASGFDPEAADAELTAQRSSWQQRLFDALAAKNMQCMLLSLERSSEVQRLAAYMTLPALPDTVVAEILHLPMSVFYQMRRTGDVPPSFYLGRRSYTLTSDLTAWLKSKARAEAAPGNRRTRRERKADAEV